MNFGETLRTSVNFLKALSLGLPMALLPKAAFAQSAADAAAAPAAAPAADAASGYVPLGPEMIVGQPKPGGWWLQEQHSPVGHDAVWMNDYILTPVIIAICVLVLVLLLYVVVRFNKRANPVPSKTSHNTLLEVLWTGIPIVILVLIAVPSLNLLAEQYKSPPKDALTVKATGYQWYWGYTYPDNGGFEVISNMLPDEEAVAKGLPPQLAVDHRMVVPVGVPIRLQTTGADVIHSFAVPSLWFKLDAVPGRLNERLLQIDKPGIYYGQCSELCGARHGYMPIAIEALPKDKFDAWVLAQGGELAGKKPADAAAPAAAADAAAPAAAPADAKSQEAEVPAPGAA